MPDSQAYDITQLIIKNIELDKIEKEVLSIMNNEQMNLFSNSELHKLFDSDTRQFLASNVLIDSIYALFPYSDPKYISEDSSIISCPVASFLLVSISFKS